MENRKIKIILWQVTGFLAVIALLWLDEIADIPHYVFNAKKTPINWEEVLFESFTTTVLGIVTIIISMKLINRINVLEGVIPICSKCHKVRIKNDGTIIDPNAWIDINEFIYDRTDAQLSHSMCPDCLKVEYPDTYNRLQKKAGQKAEDE
ncbi:MAG: hypothetical protein JXR97_12880 [Planctomycetes bacterium]|nr:hypothetical protein [Planctomycetota bacterium]